MASYLVTGGAGFIGSALVRRLIDNGAVVRVADNFSTGSRDNLAGVLDRIELLEGDLIDADFARAAATGVDYIFHEAAIASVPHSLEDPIGHHHANLSATVNLLTAAQRTGVKRLVFASSSAVYGNSKTLPVTETTPDEPISPYAVTKLASEKYCQSFSRVFGFETVCLRYFNVFGPRQSPSSPYSGVISLFLDASLNGKRPTIFGDGEQSRDFVFVENVVDANLLACSSKTATAMVFNVGCGERHSLNTLVQTLSRAVGHEITPSYGPPRQGDALHSQADISLARSVLGYEPRVGLEEGLKHTLRWFQSARLNEPHLSKVPE